MRIQKNKSEFLNKKKFREKKDHLPIPLTNLLKSEEFLIHHYFTVAYSFKIVEHFEKHFQQTSQRKIMWEII